jgi:hypothetical protein
MLTATIYVSPHRSFSATRATFFRDSSTLGEELSSRPPGPLGGGGGGLGSGQAAAADGRRWPARQQHGGRPPTSAAWGGESRDWRTDCLNARSDSAVVRADIVFVCSRARVCLCVRVCVSVREARSFMQCAELARHPSASSTPPQDCGADPGQPGVQRRQRGTRHPPLPQAHGEPAAPRPAPSLPLPACLLPGVPP